MAISLDFNVHWSYSFYCRLKRCTVWELWVEFYLGQNEDCSPGDSMSDSSERLLQRVSGGRLIHRILVKGEFNEIKHLFYKRFSASHKELMSSWRDLLVQLLSHVQICDTMDCSMQSFLVLHHLPELAQTHVHWVSDAIQPSCPLLSPYPPAFNLPQHQGLF